MTGTAGQRMPAGDCHRARCEVPVQLEPRLDQVSSEFELHWIARPVERQELEAAAADGRVKAGRGAHVDQQLEVALTVLDDAVERRAVGLSIDLKTKVRRQFARKLPRGRARQHASTLPLAQAVKQVVPANDKLLAAVWIVAVLHRCDMPFKDRGRLPLD